MKLHLVRLGMNQWDARYKRGDALDGHHRYLWLDAWFYRVCLIWGGAR
jgi:hypothetical protein